jgi:hypothetical protein
MPRSKNAVPVPCPHCGKSRSRPYLSRHIRSCIKNPIVLKKLQVWAEDNAVYRYGEQVFPSILVYKATKTAGTPAHRSIYAQVKTWGEFRETIAPHMVAPNSDAKWKRNTATKEEESYGKGDGLRHSGERIESHFNRAGRFVREEVVYPLI